jgi:hypothetical protein
MVCPPIFLVPEASGIGLGAAIPLFFMPPSSILGLGAGGAIDLDAPDSFLAGVWQGAFSGFGSALWARRSGPEVKAAVAAWTGMAAVRTTAAVRLKDSLARKLAILFISSLLEGLENVNVS